MRLFIPTLSVLLLFIFSSCQQEPDIILDDVTPDPPVASADTTMLLQYIQLNPTDPSDTLNKEVFTYDAKKRVTRLVYTSPGPDGNENIDYFYTGDDTLPSKCVYTWSDASSTYRDTIFLSYANGIVSRDSTIEYKITTNEFWGTDVDYFIPDGNNMKVIRRQYFQPGLTPPDDEQRGTLIQTRVNGNLTSQDDTATVTQVYFNRPHHTASYDSKINPFYRIDIRYPVLGIYSNFQKNNLVAEKQWDTNDPASVYELSYSYTYRSDGYPLTVMRSEPGAPPFAKGVYVYSH